VSGQINAPADLPQRKNSGAHWIGSSAGPRVPLDLLKKRLISCPYRDSKPSPSSL